MNSGIVILKQNRKETPEVNDFSERCSLDIFISGNNGPTRWNYKASPTDFFNIKSAVEMILSRLGINADTLDKGESDRRYFAESITYLSGNNKLIAEAGRISDKYLQKFDIPQDVYYAHLDWDLLLKIISDHSIVYSEISKYPSVKRDLALLLDKEIKFSRIREIAIKTEKHLIKNIDLFDVYESESLGQNKKSYAVSFTLR